MMLMPRHCTVSVDKSTLPPAADPDSMEVEAASVFDAAASAIERWSMVWWWNGARIIEVRAGDEVWRVSVERVREWNRERRVKRIA
jgi:hypothetical protein